MNYSRLIIILAFTLSCCSTNEYSLRSDPILANYFSKSDIRDLQQILNFFENEICTDTSTSIKNCYDNFFDHLRSLEDLSDFKGLISNKKQVELLNSLNPGLFNAIWYYRTDYVPRLGDSLKSIHFKWPGKYFSFLDTLARNDEAIANYVETLTLVGDISPYFTSYAMMNSPEFQLKYERTRLIIAINFLTLNEELRLNSQ